MNENCMIWNKQPGHYEVWYVTLTDPETGLGFWIRYTMVAPLKGSATCSLWFMAMDANDPTRNVGEKVITSDRVSKDLGRPLQPTDRKRLSQRLWCIGFHR